MSAATPLPAPAPRFHRRILVILSSPRRAAAAGAAGASGPDWRRDSCPAACAGFGPSPHKERFPLPHASGKRQDPQADSERNPAPGDPPAAASRARNAVASVARRERTSANSSEEPPSNALFPAGSVRLPL